MELPRKTPLKVGIAGYGVVGRRRRHFIDKHPALKTMAVCDRTFQGEGMMSDGIRFHSDYRQLLQENLDILFVCMTNDIAAEVTIAGLEKGLHVFCEKPPGRDVGDIARVVASEKKHPGLKLKYGFNHRYHDSVLDALKLVHSGELGQVLNHYPAPVDIVRKRLLVGLLRTQSDSQQHATIVQITPNNGNLGHGSAPRLKNGNVLDSTNERAGLFRLIQVPLT